MKINLLKKRLFISQEQLENCTKNYYEISQENLMLKEMKEIYLSEKLFYIQVINIFSKKKSEICQELNMFKQEVKFLNEKIESLNQISVQKKLDLELYDEKGFDRFLKEKLNNVSET